MPSSRIASVFLTGSLGFALLIHSSAFARAGKSNLIPLQNLGLNPRLQTKSQFVDARMAGLVRDALAVFYHECGFYPDLLERLLQPTEMQPSCLHGTKNAPLESSNQLKSTIEKLTYTPFGYDDFELSIRLYWTRD